MKEGRPMRRFWTITGGLIGGLVKGRKGAIFGAALGYGVDWLLAEPSQPAEEREVAAPGSAHPEEAILEGMRQAQSDPATEGDEMVSLYEEVVGSHPAGLVDAELGSREKPG